MTDMTAQQFSHFFENKQLKSKKKTTINLND